MFQSKINIRCLRNVMERGTVVQFELESHFISSLAVRIFVSSGSESLCSLTSLRTADSSVVLKSRPAGFTETHRCEVPLTLPNVSILLKESGRFCTGEMTFY